MSRAPRASITIDLLTDQDFALLMAEEGGAEAFGVFVAVLVAGRERLQHGRAHRIEGTDALAFDDRPAHILILTRVGKATLARTLEILAAVAADSGSEPWLYLNDAGHLVIRSFFKFNVPDGWGGTRPGAGRPSRKPLDSSNGNHLDSETNQVGAPPSPSPSPVPSPSPSHSPPAHAHAREAFKPTTDNRIHEGPPEWQALLARAKEFWPEPMLRFHGELAEAWKRDGFLMAYWNDHGSGPFVDAMEDLGAKFRPPRYPKLDDFAAFVRQAKVNPRRPRVVAADADAPPPKTNSQRRYESNAAAARKIAAERRQANAGG